MEQNEILDRLPQPLNEEQQAELFKKYYATKDEECRNKLVSHNLKLAASVIQKYYNNTTIAFDDLFQIASIELVNIVEKYNPELGYSFSTFATVCIKNRLLKHVIKDANEKQVIYLDEPLRDECGDMLSSQFFLTDIIEDKSESDIEGDYLKEQNFSDICKWVREKCTPMEIVVFDALLGNNDSKEKDCLELADELNLSKQRVYEIRKSLKDKIKRKFFKEQETVKEKK